MLLPTALGAHAEATCVKQPVTSLLLDMAALQKSGRVSFYVHVADCAPLAQCTSSEPCEMKTYDMTWTEPWADHGLLVRAA